MQDISLDPIKMFYLILVLMLLPLTLGIIISNKYPVFAAKLKKFMTAFSLIFFGFFLIFAIVSNLKYFQHFKGIVCLSVIFLNLMAYLIGYAFAKLVGVSEENRRAVSIETGIQNSGLGLILIFNFFEGLGGMALICSLLGNLAYFLRPFIIHLLVEKTNYFYYSMKKVLITGACGYIGKQLIQKLLQQQVSILATDIVENQFVTENKNYTFLKADLRADTIKNWIIQEKPDVVIHLSGYCFTH
jgi:hypothetical protein